MSILLGGHALPSGYLCSFVIDYECLDLVCRFTVFHLVRRILVTIFLIQGKRSLSQDFFTAYKGSAIAIPVGNQSA